MARINKFRSNNFLINSHNKYHGFTLCAKILLNMIFELLPHLCTPHIQLSVRSLIRAVNIKHRFNHKDQEVFPMPRKEGHPLVDLTEKHASSPGSHLITCSGVLWLQGKKNEKPLRSLFVLDSALRYRLPCSSRESSL